MLSPETHSMAPVTNSTESKRISIPVVYEFHCGEQTNPTDRFRIVSDLLYQPSVVADLNCKFLKDDFVSLDHVMFGDKP